MIGILGAMFVVVVKSAGGKEAQWLAPQYLSHIQTVIFPAINKLFSALIISLFKTV